MMASPKGSILITGANGTISTAIVSRIASTPSLATAYHGIYTVRDTSKTKPLQAALKSVSHSQPHSHDVFALELSDLASVRETAAAINAKVKSGKIPRIRVLFLIAGIIEFETQSWNEDGLDMTFVSNYLGHWLLTMLLLESMDADCGRIVVLGSTSYEPTHKQSAINFPDATMHTFFPDENLEGIAYGTQCATKDDPSFSCGYRRYGHSKACGVMMIDAPQRRLNIEPHLSNISILGVDPGSIGSDLCRNGPWFIRTLTFKIVQPLLAWLMFICGIKNPWWRLASQSSKDLLEAAVGTKPPIGAYPKGLYLNGSEVGRRTPESCDVEKQEMVWRESVRLARLLEGETVLRDWR